MAAFHHTSACFFLWAAFLVPYTITAPAPVAEGDISHSQSLDYHNESGTSRCYYNFQHYEEGDRIVTNEPCLNCTCHKRMLMCYLRVCPFTKAIGQDCTVEKKPDQCCPVITCPQVPVDILTSSTTTEPTTSSALGHLSKYGCTLEDNTFYPDGVQMPSDHKKPCELCYCIRNQTACVRQECTLNVEGCRPIYQEGVCCPVRYDCDYNEIGTTERPSTGGLLLGTTASPLQCPFGDTVYNDGELIDTEKPCESCYCMRGDIVCAVRSCGEPLEGSGCEPLPTPEGQCCPTTYKCANGTFPVEALVTQSSIVMHPADLQTSRPSDQSNHEQSIKDAVNLSNEEDTSEEPLNKGDEVIPSKLPSDEEKVPEESDEDNVGQINATGEHIEADPVDDDEFEEELKPSVVHDAGMEPDKTNLVTDVPEQSSKYPPTTNLGPEVIQKTDISQSSYDHFDAQDTSDTHWEQSSETIGAPEEQSNIDLNKDFVSSEIEVKPEEQSKPEETTAYDQDKKEEHEEEGSNGEEGTGTERQEETSDVPPADQTTGNEISTHINKEEIIDEQEVPEANTEQDSVVNQDEVKDGSSEEHIEQKPSLNEESETTSLDEKLSDTEVTNSEIVTSAAEGAISESEGKPDNADGVSTDVPVKPSETSPDSEENDNNKNIDNIIIHEESATNVPSSPEILDQTQDSDVSSDNTSQYVTDLPKPDTSDNTEAPTNDDKKDIDSAIESSSLPEQEDSKLPVNSFPKEPIPPRKDDAVPEEHEHHPEGSMTKAEDSIPEDQTQAVLSETELPQISDIASDEDTTKSSSEINEPIDATQNNIIHNDVEDSSSDSVDPNNEIVHDTQSVESESSDDQPSEPQGTQEPIKEPSDEVINVEEQTTSSVSNDFGDKVENVQVPDRKSDEIAQSNQQLSASEENKPIESEDVFNVVVTESEQESVTDRIHESSNNEENDSLKPTVQDNTQESGSATKNTQEEPADVPGTAEPNIYEIEKTESTEGPFKGVNSEQEKEDPTNQQATDSNEPNILNSLPSDVSSVSLDDNTQSPINEDTAEVSTNKIESEINKDEVPVTEDSPSEEPTQGSVSNEAGDLSVPAQDVADNDMTETTSSEEDSSKAPFHQPDHEETSEPATDSSIKEIENRPDELTNIQTDIKSQEDDGGEKLVDSSSHPKPIDTSETHPPSSLPEHSHDEENTDESELQEVPHDPVESDPTDFEEDDITGEHNIDNESPSENEIVDDHHSGHGGSIEYDTAMAIPGPVGVVPGEGDCLVDGQTYTNNSKIPSKSPCHKECNCLSSIVHCQGIDCPPPPPELANCMPVHQADLCCPVYTCDGDIPEGPQSHNQMGAVEDPSGETEENPLPSSTSNINSNGPSEVETTSETNIHSEEKDSSEQLAGQAIEDSVHPTKSVEEGEKPSSASPPEGTEEQNPIDSEIVPDIEDHTKPNSEENSNPNDHKESEPTEEIVVTDNEVKHNDQTSDSNNNLEETVELSHDDSTNEKIPLDTVSEAQAEPTETPEENSSIQPNSGENVPVESEKHSVGSENQDPLGTVAENLPSKLAEPLEEESVTNISEDDPKQSENVYEPQSPSEDVVHITEINSEVVTEISSSTDKLYDTVTSVSTENNSDGSSSLSPDIEDSSEEGSNTQTPGEQPSGEQTETVQDKLATSDDNEDQSILDQENQKHISEDINQSTTEEVQSNQTNEESSSMSGDLNKPIEHNEGNDQIALVESDDTSSDKNEDKDHNQQENTLADDKSEVPIHDGLNQNNYATEEPNALSEDLATANPYDSQMGDGSEHASNELIVKHDTDQETESPQNTVHQSTNESSGDDNVDLEETTEISQSSPVEKEQPEKDELASTETSPMNLPSDEHNQEIVSPEATLQPIVEEQHPIVGDAPVKHKGATHESHIPESDSTAVENENQDQSESIETDKVVSESESEIPDKASDDLPAVEHDNTGESDLHKEQMSTISDPSSTSEINLEGTKVSDIDEEQISTEGYNDKLPIPESDDLKTETNSDNIQFNANQEPVSQELDSSTNTHSSPVNAVTDEEESSKPLPELVDTDQQVSQSVNTVQSEDQSLTATESEKTDQKSEDTAASDHKEVSPTEENSETNQSVHAEEEVIVSEENEHAPHSDFGSETHSEKESGQKVEEDTIVSDNKGSDEDSRPVHEEDETEDKEKDDQIKVSEVPATTVHKVDEQKNEEEPIHEAELSAQGEESVNSNMDEHSHQETEHTSQDSDNSESTVESEESDNTIPQQVQPDKEIEHSGHPEEHPPQESGEVPEQSTQESGPKPEQSNQESEQPDYHPEDDIEHNQEQQGTHETGDISHTSSQTQDSNSLPISSEDTHSTGDDSKPDINKPDSEIPSEDQFPSSPDMDYDVTEDGAFGPGTCRYGGKVYVSAQQIPRDDPCDFCFCFRSDIICLQQSCPPPIHRCHQEPIQGYCCPRYQCPVSMATSLNVTTTTTTTTTTLPPHFFAHAYLGAARQAGCLHKGRAFSVGEEIPTASGPCLHCICGADGQMRCDPVVCSPEPQLRRMMEAAISHRRR